MTDELLATIDDLGDPLTTSVPRSEAHRRGVWHRAVVVFVLNPYGEILLEKRSKHKDLFPGSYDIPGGHVAFGSTPIATAIRELSEEIGLDVPVGRLHPLSAEDALVERTVIPEKGIINLERKTAYLLVLTELEEAAVLSRASQFSSMSASELEALGSRGEVSQVEFWPWERLLDAVIRRGPIPIASGTETALTYPPTREWVSEKCFDLRRDRIRRFADRYGAVFSAQGIFDLEESRLTDVLLDVPAERADPADVASLFDDGVEQLAGAYRIGPFRLLAAGSSVWDPKLHDPHTTYVTNILAAVGRGTDSRTRARLVEAVAEVEAFVHDLLNLPRSDGPRLRDDFGNLVDIAAARRAVLLWLEYHASDLLSRQELRHPLRRFVERSIGAGRILLKAFHDGGTFRDDKDRLAKLLLLGLGAASIDFNTPDLQQTLPSEDLSPAWLAEYARTKASTSLYTQLGADFFVDEFCREYVTSGRACSIAFLPGNSAQAYLSLALCQEFLESNSSATISFIPKSGAPGNDLTASDVHNILVDAPDGLLNSLRAHARNGRFTLVRDGPSCHGLDPRRLSREAAAALRKADVVFAEGQAYAEIRGWTKPTYVAFRVNGRVAEAIHGVSRQVNACGFVRLTPGVAHFEDFGTAVSRRIADPETGSLIPAARQTTADFVAAILSDNCRLLTDGLFKGDRAACYRSVRLEAQRLDTTFAAVVIGHAWSEPREADVRAHYAVAQYPVFACGGGGGFNSVTLKALRMLGLPVAAGVPSTDDGGSSGDLQRWFRERRGFVFGVGDMAAILQDSLANKGKQAILAYRFDSEPRDLPAAVLNRIAIELGQPTYPESALGTTPDLLSFICDQLNLARVLEEKFRRSPEIPSLPVKGSSIRNLNVVAAHELCGCLGDAKRSTPQNTEGALYVLEKSLGVPAGLLALPVTYDSCALYLDYDQVIPQSLADDYRIPRDQIQQQGHRLVGQRYIDKLPLSGRRLRTGVIRALDSTERPTASPHYLARLRSAKLFIMGAGSLFSSQLAQLAVGGVVDELLTCQDIRRILVLNHVRMDETIGMSLKDHVVMIESVASDNASAPFLRRFAAPGGGLQISSLFTDIVVPRTVAREVTAAMDSMNVSSDEQSGTVDIAPMPGGTPQSKLLTVNRNRYTAFLASHPEIVARLQLTRREIEVLSYLDYAAGAQAARTEIGRYRGALFATDEDIEYLVARGIQRRSIHEIDSVGQNWKIVKAAGAPSFEFFPGLVPEALLGIIKIALERGSVGDRSRAS